jgi:hypothetical protein
MRKSFGAEIEPSPDVRGVRGCCKVRIASTEAFDMASRLKVRPAMVSSRRHRDDAFAC